MAFPPARAYQQALFAAGIPATALITTNIEADVAQLTARGVRFRGVPKRMGPISAVGFEDACGNLITPRPDTRLDERPVGFSTEHA